MSQICVCFANSLGVRYKQINPLPMGWGEEAAAAVPGYCKVVDEVIGWIEASFAGREAGTRPSPPIGLVLEGKSAKPLGMVD